MANTLKVKNSGTATSVPSSLVYGELALNYTDGKLFYKNGSDTIVGAKLITGITGTTDQVTVTETSGSFAISLPSTVKVSNLYVNNIQLDPTGATSNQVLSYNGTKFVPVTNSATATTSATDLTSGTLDNARLPAVATTITTVGTLGSLAVTNGVTAATFTGALTDNASTATSAATLTTARTLWGQSFNGSAAISGALTGVTTVALSGATSGTTTLQASAVAGTTTITLPAASGTVALTDSAMTSSTFIGTTSVALNRSSGALTLAGITLTTPVLGVATATSINGLTITSSTGTLTVTNAKTLSVSNTLTLAGTDSTTMTFPSTSATIARTDAANTFTGVQTMTSPAIATSLTTGSASFDLLNTTATTVNFAGAATTLTIGASTATINLGGGTTGATVNIKGDLVVEGTTTTINSTTISVDDKNIELGSVDTPTNVTADGGGITLRGTTDKTLNWVSATSAWTSSEDFNLLTGKAYEINGTAVLSSTTLGSGVTGSSLTSVGTIGTGVWNGTVIAGQYGGTGVANTGKTITLGGNLTTSGAFALTLTQTGTTTVTLPTSGTLVSSADTGTVTSTMILDGTILNADINASAAIELSKLATTGTMTATTFVGALTGTASGNLVSGGALGTPSSGTLTNCTFPTLNQNTTGTAATVTGAAQTSITSVGTLTGLTVSGTATVRAAATQDGVALAGRAGGTSTYEVTLTPTTLTADRTLTLPDDSGTVATTINVRDTMMKFIMEVM